MHHAHIDKFAYQDSPLHRLDARVKLVSTLIFTVLVLMLPRQGVSVQACYAVWPFSLLVIAGVPLRFALRHILIACLFVAALALVMPFYDTMPATATFGPFQWTTTAGWLRCGAIIAKFVVTMAALIALVSTTRFSDLLAAMEKMGMPQVLVTQLGFLYRYIFVLVDRMHHMLRARAARRLRSLPVRRELAIGGAMVGSLLLHSIDTAGRVSVAMEARGFDGRFRTLRNMRFGMSDAAFSIVFLLVMLLLHFVVRPLFELR